MLELRTFPRQCVGDTILYTELCVNLRITSYLKRVAHQFVRIRWYPDLDTVYFVGIYLMFPNQRKSDSGASLCEPAARIFLEDYFIELILSAKALGDLLRVDFIPAEKMKISIDTLKEVSRACYPMGCISRTCYRCFSNPALYNSHGERTVHVALKTAPASIECQGERIPGLCFIETQHFGRHRCCCKYDTYARGIKPVV